MRVLHIGKFFPPHPGGMEVFLADLVRAQRARGIDAAALVHGQPLPDDPEWLMRVPVWGHLVYAPLAPGFRTALAAAIRQFRPDVLHLHLPNTSAFWALLLLPARDLPWVVHWHSDVVVSRIRGALALAYRLYRPFEQAVLDRAERILVTSPSYLEASEPLSRWRDKCSVIPLALDSGRLPEHAGVGPAPSWREGNFRLLSIGRLTYYKGFETLIRAVSAMPGVELLIVGEGALRPTLETLIDEFTPAGVEPNIRLLGGIDDAGKHALLQDCDVFCLASRERTEAFGIVLLEAMRYARPCIVADLPGSGMPWVVREGGAGVAVPVEDVAAWRDAIRAFQRDPHYREGCGAQGQRALCKKFALDRCVESIASEYAAVVPDAAVAAPDKDLLIVIPARNEAETIAAVIRSLHEAGWRDVIVVNDQSTDATGAIAAAAGATVLSPVLPLGAWGAMQTGIRYALRHGYRQVVTIDADGQHEPACIPVLLAAARSHDVVIGAFPQRGSRLRRIAWRYFRAITGFGIDDLTSGFRCYNRAACEILAADEATLLDYQDLGVLLMLRHAGLEIAEVPVAMYPRATGPSRIFASWSRVARYMAESTLLCLARWHPKHHLSR
ncbi:glycosyltransferase [Aromatoleum aromaticum]|nr:glycosyltransferase [Aromatoleum aromaticum]NMG56057.1 glycosyltransferase [Aromatoleum aromaticum]